MSELIDEVGGGHHDLIHPNEAFIKRRPCGYKNA